jgi:hypothetical protein
MANGKTTRWRVVEFLYGQTADSTLVITLMIKKRATVHSIGQMVESMKVSGLTESNMA